MTTCALLSKRDKSSEAFAMFSFTEGWISSRCRTAVIATLIIAILVLADDEKSSNTNSPSSPPSLHATLSPMIGVFGGNNWYSSSKGGECFSATTMSRRSSFTSSIIGLIGGYKGKDSILHKKQAKLPKSKRIGARFRYRVKVRQLWTKKGHKKIYKARHHKPLKFKTHGDGEFRSERIRNQAKRVAAGNGKKLY
mmetsp:Transcript_8940/g.12307  ORF Transcript_8940/g.12307 Transcript_8940/m.12307 type:complete len:195 (-) Transcript_8940:104-688(-)